MNNPESAFCNPEAFRHPGSYRDPAGYVFTDDAGTLCRAVAKEFGDEYDAVVSSGLYEELHREGLLVSHQEGSSNLELHRILTIERLPFISYPYEWSAEHIRMAALLTLEIQRRAIRRGVSLRDASIFNVQFKGAKPVFIDTLSFERFNPKQPWKAYRQFCMNFLAPLAVQAQFPEMAAFWRGSINGFPLSLASKLVPFFSWRGASSGMLLHLHLHSWFDRSTKSGSAAKSPVNKQRAAFCSEASHLGQLDSLVKTITSIRTKQQSSTWSGYYSELTYTDLDFQNKLHFVNKIATQLRPKTVWDLGCNTGLFSLEMAKYADFVVGFDFDALCIGRFLKHLETTANRNILPLTMDLLNPSPGLGWAGSERASLASRGPADLIVALALIHHLVISGNVPLPMVAKEFSRFGNNLVIEFVFPEDVRVRQLMAANPAMECRYDEAQFIAAFEKYYTVSETQPLGTRRLYYLCRK